MLAYASIEITLLLFQSHCLIRFNSFFYKLFQFIISFGSREVEQREGGRNDIRYATRSIEIVGAESYQCGKYGKHFEGFVRCLSVRYQRQIRGICNRMI